MRSTDFPEANLTYGKPAEMTDEECGSLRVHKYEGGAISRWLPTEEEKKAIAEGKPIWLYVIGGGHPPVALTTERPFR